MYDRSQAPPSKKIINKRLKKSAAVVRHSQESSYHSILRKIQDIRYAVCLFGTAGAFSRNNNFRQIGVKMDEIRINRITAAK